MQKKIIILLALFLVLPGIYFARLMNNRLPNNPSIKRLEKFVRKRQDERAVFTFDQYESLLKLLKNDKYIVLPLNEFRDSINNSKILVGLRHDVDRHPFKALEMAKMENRYGFRTTYFILATAPYYGKFKNKTIRRFTCMEDIYKQIYCLGNEIGIHNDLLTIMIQYNIDPFVFNADEIKFFKNLYIEIHGTVAHGSFIAQKSRSNFEIFSNFAKSDTIIYQGKTYTIGNHSLADFGFEYEANYINYTKYYSESGGVWSIPGGYDQLIQELKDAQPGARIQILTHPVWWGKQE